MPLAADEIPPCHCLAGGSRGPAAAKLRSPIIAVVTVGVDVSNTCSQFTN